MSESQSTQTLRGFTPFSVQTSGDSTIFDSMSLEDLEVEMELSQKCVANILKAQNSLKSEPQSETENMESTSLTDIELAEIIWNAMKPQRDDEDEDAEVASVTEHETVGLVADLPYGFLQLPEAKCNSQWYIKRLRLYSEIECRLLGLDQEELQLKRRLTRKDKIITLVDLTRRVIMAIGGKRCAINVCLPLVVCIAFLCGVYIGEATDSETGKPGNNFWNVVNAELQTIW
ncbi:hypothetical protein C8R41DRAFT_927674 [Lentinula lateritia]|uniref:Uncharacterized protein n=1 Tax=Lentinula lateritia TaxID=40482 RepID=A0ABQ8UVS3_9AGAR|nr:hypothetical protein C8R41DRAFT_927674 [Lentinula lateritia]